MAGLATTFGSGAMTNSIGEISGAACLLVIGSNTTEAHPIIGLQVRKSVREMGARLIVVSPLEIDLCRIADLWLRLRPGTDVALLNGLAHVILRDGLEDRDFVKSRTEGYEAWRDSVAMYTPQLVSRITGVPSEQIEAAAKMYATAGGRPGGTSSILYAMGITQHSHGTDNVLAVGNLAMLTGNVGKPSSGVNPLRGQNNVQGACDMGALPDVYPGYQKVLSEEARQKFEAAWGSRLPPEPGLTMPEMVDAIETGQIQAMYILGENPVVSDPDAGHLRHALQRLEFLVVQDIFLTETAQLADVVLPGASFAEKDGTFTNTERRVQLIRKAIEAVGESRPDWEVIEDLARRTIEKVGRPSPGLPDQFQHAGPSEVLEEAARLTPQYAGINYWRLEEGSLQWPVPSLVHPSTPVLHVGVFARGKGRFVGVEYLPAAELPNIRYPLLLTTGRRLYHYHTGTMTRRVAGLSSRLAKEYLRISPKDAAARSISSGELVVVMSRRGKIRATAEVSDIVPDGVVFLDFHFAESPANFLTSPARDPEAKIAELKVCAVRLEKLSA